MCYKMSRYSYVIVLFLGFQHCDSMESILRQTTYGKIRGFQTERIPGKPVQTFLGIPYATPPVGNLRFEKPKPPVPWSGILDTLKLPAACPQYDNMDYIEEYYPGFRNYSEDCLYINIYVPKVSPDDVTNLPVLVYIHGGSNRVGMGSMLEGDILAGHGNIIVVTFNYRLGIFGFVGAREEGLEGTYAFLDQIKALKWVKNNIKEFGGDPNRITIHGHSAGAANVGFHSVSHLSKGLFDKVIIHSGSPLAFWAVTDPEWPEGYNIKPTCKILWMETECKNITFKEYLRSLDIATLSNMKGLGTPRDLITFPAVIDGEFLTARPHDLFSRGEFNVKEAMIALARDEGFPIDGKIIDYVNNLSVSKVNDIIKEYSTVFGNVDKFTEIVTDRYKEFQDAEPYFQILHQVNADLLFFAPAFQLADFMSRHVDALYLHSFDHVSRYSKQPKWQGVPHGIDLFYVFGVPLVGHDLYQYDELDIKASKKVMTLWGDFVRGKKLNIPGYKTDSKVFSRLTSDGEKIQVKRDKDFRPDKMHFWNVVMPSLNTKSNISCKSCMNIVILAISILVNTLIFL